MLCRAHAQAANRDILQLFAEAARQIPKKITSFAESYDSIVENYRKEQKERKRLFNLVQELRCVLGVMKLLVRGLL